MKKLFFLLFSLLVILNAAPAMSEEPPAAPAAETPKLSTKKAELLAIELKKEGKFAEAQPLLEQVLAAKTARFGAQDPFTGATAISLAEVYKAQGKLKEALPLFQQGYDMLREPQYPDFNQLIYVLEEMADINEQTGNIPEGMKLRERAVQADLQHQKILGKKSE